MAQIEKWRRNSVLRRLIDVPSIEENYFCCHCELGFTFKDTKVEEYISMDTPLEKDLIEVWKQKRALASILIYTSLTPKVKTQVNIKDPPNQMLDYLKEKYDNTFTLNDSNFDEWCNQMKLILGVYWDSIVTDNCEFVACELRWITSKLLQFISLEIKEEFKLREDDHPLDIWKVIRDVFGSREDEWVPQCRFCFKFDHVKQECMKKLCEDKYPPVYNLAKLFMCEEPFEIFDMSWLFDNDVLAMTAVDFSLMKEVLTMTTVGVIIKG